MNRLLDIHQVFGNGADNLLRPANRKTGRSHVWHRGRFSEMRRHVPGRFTRVPFEYGGKVNPLLEVICNAEGMPLSVVSPAYALMNHVDVVGALANAVRAIGLEVDHYPVEIYVGHHGARFGLRLVLSDIASDPGDGHPVGGRVEVLNSMDRSLPLRITFGHHRLVCSNGLMIFLTTVNLLEVHLRGRLDQEKVNKAIMAGVASLGEKGDRFRALHETSIPHGFTKDLLAAVAGVWGEREAKAIEAALAGGVYRGARVPGLTVPVETLWGVYNALTWVAGRSQNLARQTRMSEAAHGIIEEAMKIHGIEPN